LLFLENAGFFLGLTESKVLPPIGDGEYGMYALEPLLAMRSSFK
jgi:hypothetical protein